jgi:hypothetical protein
MQTMQKHQNDLFENLNALQNQLINVMESRPESGPNASARALELNKRFEAIDQRLTEGLAALYKAIEEHSARSEQGGGLSSSIAPRAEILPSTVTLKNEIRQEMETLLATKPCKNDHSALRTEMTAEMEKVMQHRISTMQQAVFNANFKNDIMAEMARVTQQIANATQSNFNAVGIEMNSVKERLNTLDTKDTIRTKALQTIEARYNSLTTTAMSNQILDQLRPRVLAARDGNYLHMLGQVTALQTQLRQLQENFTRTETAVKDVQNIQAIDTAKKGLTDGDIDDKLASWWHEKEKRMVEKLGAKPAAAVDIDAQLGSWWSKEEKRVTDKLAIDVAAAVQSQAEKGVKPELASLQIEISTLQNQITAIADFTNKFEEMEKQVESLSGLQLELQQKAQDLEKARGSENIYGRPDSSQDYDDPIRRSDPDDEQDREGPGMSIRGSAANGIGMAPPRAPPGRSLFDRVEVRPNHDG